jgi:hypothetical protein
MARKQPSLPGIRPATAGRGRNQRSIDKLAAMLRATGDYDDHTAALVTLSRDLAAAIDRLEADPDRSEHTIGTLARVQLDLLRELAPAAATFDPFAVLDDELSTALRHSAQT